VVLSLTIGLAGVADAQKKGKKKKGAKSVTVSKAAPTAVGPANFTTANSLGVASVPLSVGKKAKGKVVGWDSVTVTTSWSAPAPDVLDNVFARLKAPNGRTVGLAAPPIDDTVTAAGPVTETPNSPFDFCLPSATPPPPPCADPDDTVGPPYAGTVGNTGLAFFGGVPARGTWQLQILNSSDTSGATLNSVSVRMTLKTAPR
jgi:hypothetical protein